VTGSRLLIGVRNAVAERVQSAKLARRRSTNTTEHHLIVGSRSQRAMRQDGAKSPTAVKSSRGFGGSERFIQVQAHDRRSSGAASCPIRSADFVWRPVLHCASTSSIGAPPNRFAFESSRAGRASLAGQDIRVSYDRPLILDHELDGVRPLSKGSTIQV